MIKLIYNHNYDDDDDHDLDVNVMDLFVLLLLIKITDNDNYHLFNTLTTQIFLHRDQWLMDFFFKSIINYSRRHTFCFSILDHTEFSIG